MENSIKRFATRRCGLGAMLIFILLMPLMACSSPRVRSTPRQRGEASWYGHPFHGRKTASGERYNMHELTAAHQTLRLGSRVRVRSLTTGRSVTVRINDRGPYAKARIIDLSYGAARRLGMVKRGEDDVEIIPLR